tara:strand:- start:71 stop:1027 length:957 start_codon:yes stop_codon:yes gene_type:complete
MKAIPKIYKPRLRKRRCDFLEFLKTTRFVPVVPVTEEWWIANVKTFHSTIALKCPVCQHEVHPKFDNFFRENSTQRGTARCRCSGRGLWNTETSRHELLKIIDASGYIARGFLISETEYQKQNVNDKTHIPVECSKCHHLATRCKLGHFVGLRSAGCNCTNKTQAFVHDWIVQHVEAIAKDGLLVASESYYQSIRSKKGKSLPYDIVVFRKIDRRVLLIVEVDGRQHFEDVWGEEVLRCTQQNDLQKEIDAVQRNVPLVRLHQPSVFRGLFDWKSYMKRMLLQAWEETLPTKVYRQPGEPAYHSGSYRDLRVGTIVAV